MKIGFCVLLVFVLGGVVFADETNLNLTVDGVTYSNVTFGTATLTTVTISHSSGIATLPLAKLPPELQTRFGYSPQRVADWQKAQRQKAEMEKLDKTTLQDPLKVGMVGVSYGQCVTVVQIVSTNEMLANVNTAMPFDDNGAVQIYTDPVTGMRVVPRKAHLVWVNGVSTTGLADKGDITRKIVFKITGTKTYEATDAAIRTLFVLEPLATVEPSP